MNEPLFWLGLSLTLVAISLTAVLVILIPVLQELSRAARSAEKLFDTLNREFPDTLEAIRMTNLEITQLSGEVKGGIKSASGVVQKVDRTIVTAKSQVEKLKTVSRNFWIGVKTGIKVWNEYDQ